MQRMGIAAIMINFIRLVVGFDQREAIAYHVFVQSVIQKSSSPISFYPLSKNALSFYNEIHTDKCFCINYNNNYYFNLKNQFNY